MKISTLLKGATFAVALFTIANEASAQLPVRTRQLQLLGATSGTLTQQANTTTTSYTLTWPAAAPTGTSAALGVAAGLLRVDGTGAADWFMIGANEELVSVDANGATGQVAYFTDGNTITSSPTMTFDGAGNLGLGNAATPGTVELSDGSANTGTFVTATLGADQTYTFPDASGNVPVSTNIGTVGQILIANADGTSTWTTSDVANFRTGSVTIAAAGTTGVVTVAGLGATAVLKSFTANIVDADGTIIYVTDAAIAAGTLTANLATTVPVGAAKTVYYMFTFTP